MATEKLTLKWGTLKHCKLTEGGPAFAALSWYFEEPTSESAMLTHDTDRQKQAIFDIIEALDNDQIYLDWDGKYVSKEEAVSYVRDYGL